MLSQTYFNTVQAALYLGLSRRTMEGFRTRGGGPVYVKAGRVCRYRREDLDAWAMANRRANTSDPGQAA